MLSLQALVFIVERHPELVSRMLSRRRDRSVKRGPYSNYPWACAGITLTRKLWMLQVVVPLREANLCVRQQPVPDVAGSAEAFMELFVWTFACLERTWSSARLTWTSARSSTRRCAAPTTRSEAAHQRGADRLRRVDPNPLDNNHNNEALGDGFCLVESVGPRGAAAAVSPLRRRRRRSRRQRQRRRRRRRRRRRHGGQQAGQQVLSR